MSTVAKKKKFVKKASRRRAKKPAVNQKEFDFASADRLLEAAKEVQKKYRGVTLSTQNLPKTRVCGKDIQEKVKADLGAKDRSIVVGKTLIDERQEETVRDINAIFAEVNRVYTDPRFTLPYPTDGCRLILEDKILEFEERMNDLRAALARAAHRMATAFEGIKARQLERLGDAYNDSDYDFDPTRRVNFSWSYPSLEVSEYLQKLSPAIYHREVEHMRLQFEEACRMKEQEMAEDTVKALDNLVERLTASQSGDKPKTFRDNTVAKIFDLLDESEKQLSENQIGGSLRQYFQQVKKVIGDRDNNLPNTLRRNEALQRTVRTGLSAVADAIFEQALDAPRRKVVRKSRVKED